MLIEAAAPEWAIAPTMTCGASGPSTIIATRTPSGATRSMVTRWLPPNGRSTAAGALPGRSSHTPLEVAAHRLLSRSQLSEVTLPPGCQACSRAFRLSSPSWMTLPCPLMPASHWGVSGASLPGPA